MSAFFTLLKNDARWIWGALVFSIYICVQSVAMGQTDHMFSLSMGSNGTDIFLLIIPSMSANVLFVSGNYGAKMPNVSPFGTFEFFFSKAINRSTLFCSKTLIYLLLVLLPLSVVWIYSDFDPVVRIELPYNPKGSREITQQFYLQHFEGAYVQKDEKDREGNKYYVVLPKGKRDAATFTLLWAFTATLLLEVMIFAFPAGKRWSFLPGYLLLGIVISYLGWPSAQTPSRYETGLAWVSQHTLLTFLGLGIVTALSQSYCCRRFINTEITT